VSLWEAVTGLLLLLILVSGCVLVHKALAQGLLRGEAGYWVASREAEPGSMLNLVLVEINDATRQKKVSLGSGFPSNREESSVNEIAGENIRPGTFLSRQSRLGLFFGHVARSVRVPLEVVRFVTGSEHYVNPDVQSGALADIVDLYRDVRERLDFRYPIYSKPRPIGSDQCLMRCNGQPVGIRGRRAHFSQRKETGYHVKQGRECYDDCEEQSQYFDSLRVREGVVYQEPQTFNNRYGPTYPLWRMCAFIVCIMSAFAVGVIACVSFLAPFVFDHKIKRIGYYFVLCAIGAMLFVALTIAAFTLAFG
jgi:hypothetical protein